MHRCSATSSSACGTPTPPIHAKFGGFRAAGQATSTCAARGHCLAIVWGSRNSATLELGSHNGQSGAAGPDDDKRSKFSGSGQRENGSLRNKGSVMKKLSSIVGSSRSGASLRSQRGQGKSERRAAETWREMEKFLEERGGDFEDAETVYESLDLESEGDSFSDKKRETMNAGGARRTGNNVL
ncbi:hypothetical protein TNCV_762081 [Trichonephila clavipes]|nr:hypothetical protein TNCV_762081 [Trichonephila clavipes]